MSLARATGQVRLLSQFKESKHLRDTMKGFLNSIKGTNFKVTAFIFSPPRTMAILKTAEPNAKSEVWHLGSPPQLSEEHSTRVVLTDAFLYQQ